MVGCENRQDFKLLKTLLKDFEVIPLNSAISDKAVELFFRSTYKRYHMKA